MSWKIEIHRAKPNPTGKDANRHGPLESQLVGEWADLKNVGDASVSLNHLHLAHSTYASHCVVKTRAEIYWNGSASQVLAPGQIVRVHTGRSIYSSLMATEDREGADFHAYADRSTFVLNNDCGDELTVWWKSSTDAWQEEDSAKYGSRPVEGKILVRIGDRLI